MSNDNIQPYELVGEHVSIFQRGNRWYAHYRLDGKPIRQSLKTGSKKEARLRALAIERDILNGEPRRPVRAPSIREVVDEYITHLRGLRRSENTIRKYLFCFKLLVDVADRRGVHRIDQVNLALIDAFRLERETHRVKTKNLKHHDQSKSKNNA